MSLLLDALKKAAEQKAKKSESEPPAEHASDETLLDVAADVAERARAQESDDESSREDETEFEHAELSARLERSSVVRGAADETALDLADPTETRHQYSEPGSAADEETGLDVPEATETRIGQQRAPAAQGEDTGLDLGEATQTGFQQESPRSAADETVIDVLEADEVASDKPAKPSLSEQLQTGDDETIVFSSDDATNFEVEQKEPEAQAAQEDETDLSQLGGEDLTGIGTVEPVTGDSPVADEDETDLGQSAQAQDLTGISDPAGESIVFDESTEEDETDLGQHEPEVEPGEAEPRDAADETDISQAQSAEDAGTADVQQALPDADETDISQPKVRADQVESADAPPQQAEDTVLGDDDPTREGEESEAKSSLDVGDEDLSLLLLEPDPTSPRAAADSADTSFTDPQITGNRKRIVDDGWSELDALGLQDRTLSRADRDQTDTQGATLTNPSQTAVQGDDTRVAQDADTQTRADATSTRTYAPDNYDRTLMKLPSDDESKLFAGMKSDSDVVMTPDYAKKVFRSKTSAQRVQHYKIYLGIAIVIVLAIGIFGGMQYQQESLAIDTSLRPLKRDPMPGVIKSRQAPETSLFAGNDSEATARTIEIIEAAETIETVETGAVDSATVASATTSTAASAQPQPVEQAPTAASVSTAEASETPAAAVAAAQPQVEPQAQALPEPRTDPPASGQVAMLTSTPSQQPSTGTAPRSASNLQIESSSQYRQNDIWLREAYAAYQAGNDAQALKLYNQVLEVDPGNRNALLARAAINTQNGDFRAAIKDYQTLLLANPKDSMAMSSLLAVANYSPQESETQLKLMIHDEPDSPYLNFALANAYGAQNRWLEAQRHYFKALQSSPQNPNYAYNLAVSLEHISQPESAATYYRRALDNFDKGLATFNRDIVNQRLAVLGKP